MNYLKMLGLLQSRQSDHIADQAELAEVYRQEVTLPLCEAMVKYVKLPVKTGAKLVNDCLFYQIPS